MAKKQTKVIGEVVPGSKRWGGYMVRVTRYPNGRHLPAPRLLLNEEGHLTFRTPMQAMAALRLWQSCQFTANAWRTVAEG